MPNGEDLNEQLEFDERIKAMPPEDRTIFIAKQTYALTNKFDSIDKKVTALDGKFENFSGVGGSKKASVVTAGITTSVVIGIIEGLRVIFSKG